MAKGNLFLGLARGSVGDVTMYRRDGNQVARARVRKIANPKSSGQIYTRAILSTVAKAYSAGKIIFDHSFEGYRVPEGAQRRFLKLNLDALRSRVYDDVEQQRDASRSTPLVGPNSPSPVAGEYIVSEGTLSQNLVIVTPGTVDDPTSIKFGQPQEGETLGAFFGRLGIVKGDIFTIAMFAFGDTMAGLTPKTAFAWVQFQLGEYDPSLVAGQTYIEQVFRVAHSNNITGGEFVFSTESFQFGGDIVLNDRNIVYIDGIGLDRLPVASFNGTFAIIRSREGSPLRSSAQMQWFNLDDLGGLGWSQVIDAWTGGYQLGESDLLLEGSEFPMQTQGAVNMSASFTQPTTIASLYAAYTGGDAPVLSFSRQVTFAEVVQHLSVTGDVYELAVVNSAMILRPRGESDYSATLLLSGGRTAILIEPRGESGPQDAFSFVWQ